MTKERPTLLLTRPRAQAERFVTNCRAVLGAVDVVMSPVMTIRPLAADVDLSGYSDVVLTSENGAQVLAKLADVAGRRAWCVGDRTAVAAEALGMDAVSAGGDASDLVEMICRARPSGMLLHVHGTHTRGEVAGQLAKAGLQVQSQVIYDQAETGLSEEAQALLAQPRAVVLPLFSPRSAQLVGAGMHGIRAPLTVIALSPAVAKAWSGPKPREFIVVERPEAAHMIKAIATIWTSLVG